jgi:hypothetical protein
MKLNKYYKDLLIANNKIVLEIFKPLRKIFDIFLRNTLWFAYYIIKAKDINIRNFLLNNNG